LRSLEQAFGMGWGESDTTEGTNGRNNRTTVVSPSVQPLSGTGQHESELETDSRQGTRRLFRII